MLSWLNCILCLLAIIMCACRLGSKMSKDTTKGVVRFQYVIWLGLEMFLLLDYPATWAHIMASAAVLSHLFSTLPAWRYGTPSHALRLSRE